MQFFLNAVKGMETRAKTLLVVVKRRKEKDDIVSFGRCVVGSGRVARGVQ
jgi:hypothetical protein